MTGPRWSPYCGLHTDACLSLVQWVDRLTVEVGELAPLGRLPKTELPLLAMASASGILTSQVDADRNGWAATTAFGRTLLALDQEPWVYAGLRTWPRVNALRHIAANEGCLAAGVAAALGVHTNSGISFVEPLVRAGLADYTKPGPRTGGPAPLAVTELGLRLLAPIAEYSDPASALVGAL